MTRVFSTVTFFVSRVLVRVHVTARFHIPLENTYCFNTMVFLDETTSSYVVVQHSLLSFPFARDLLSFKVTQFCETVHYWPCRIRSWKKYPSRYCVVLFLKCTKLLWEIPWAMTVPVIIARWWELMTHVPKPYEGWVSSSCAFAGQMWLLSARWMWSNVWVRNIVYIFVDVNTCTMVFSNENHMIRKHFLMETKQLNFFSII